MESLIVRQKTVEETEKIYKFLSDVIMMKFEAFWDAKIRLEGNSIYASNISRDNENFLIGACQGFILSQKYNPQKEYKDGLVWIPKDNPLGLKQGYYTQKQIDKALEKNPEKALDFVRFMRQ